MKKTETFDVKVKFKGNLDKEQFKKFAEFLLWYKKDYEKKHPKEKKGVEITTF